MRPALELLSGLHLPDGKTWAEAATPPQWEDARAVLDPRPARPYSYVTRSRGYAKTQDAAGFVVALLLAQLPAGSRCYWLAADVDQGRLAVDSIDGFTRRTPGLAGALQVERARVVAPRSGSSVEVLAADAPSSWGIRPAFLVLDELSAWADVDGSRRLLDSMLSSLAKVEGARALVVCSAGSPDHLSYGLLEHARRDPLWRVHEVPGPPPWMSEERLAEQRRRLQPSMFARLFENQWVEGEDKLTTVADLRACVTLDGPQEPQPGVRYCCGVDLAVARDRSAAAVLHLDADGIAVLDQIAVWKPTRERPVQLRDVESYLAEQARHYSGMRVIADPHQSSLLLEHLRARGIPCESFVFTAQSVGRLGLALFQRLRDRSIALYDDPPLLDELAGVKLRESAPNTWRLDHASGQHDDQAVALALALVGLGPGPSASAGRSNFDVLTARHTGTRGGDFRRQRLEEALG